MKRISILSIALCAASIIWAEAPLGYYDSLEGKCGAALMKAAKAKVKPHTVISYNSGTWNAFEKTDTRIVNGKKCWWDMYSNNNVAVSSGHPGMNIEHSVANSWWGKTKNDAYKDLMHLNPSDSKANSSKGNYPLGEIAASPTFTNGVTNVGAPVAGQGGGNNRVFEPHDDYKGDFARAYMYMFTVYDDIAWSDKTNWMYSKSNATMFKAWAVELLLRWNREDPVDEKERNRNEAIYGIQHNRNPFIDHPELAEYIWGSKNTTPYHANGQVDPNPVDPDPVDPDPVDPDPKPTGNTLLSQDFDGSSSLPSDWTNSVTEGTLSGWFVKNFSGNNYASASAYKGTATGGPYEFWLISPEISIPADSEATLTFRTQGAYGCDDSYMEVYALDSDDPATAGRTKLPAAICTPQPDGEKPVYSDWLASGNVSLGTGARQLYLGFKYYSAAGGSGHSATYCLDDVKVIVKALESGLDEIGEEQAILVDGNSILGPEGMRVFSINGIASPATDLAPGLYIVVTPAGRTVKVAVR